MRRVLVLFTGLIACLLLTSCGIGPTRVVDDHAIKPDDRGGPSTETALRERGELTITDEAGLIKEYLNLAATDDVERRKELLGSFYLDPLAGPKADAPVNVVRLPATFPDPVQSDESQVVSLEVEHLGELKDGLLIPTGKGKQTYTFTIVNRNGLSVLKTMPSELLLSEDALIRLFDSRPLYFWSGKSLVQDLRYIPRSQHIAVRATRLLTLLYGEPADWLKRAVQRPPAETKTTDSVVVEDNNLVVTLAIKLDEPELTALAEQLALTLLEPPYTASGLEIRVQGQVQKKNYLPAPRPPTSSKLWRYGVVGGSVYRLKSPGTVAVPGFFLGHAGEHELNQNISEVAVTRQENVFALIRNVNGEQKLTMVDAAQTVQAKGLPSSGLSHPMWIGEKTLLVKAAETLYELNAATGDIVKETEIKGLGNYAVSPDGHRVALVIDNQVYLAARNDQGEIFLEDKQAVKTGFSAVYSVAFYHAGEPNRLFVAGRSGASVHIGVVNLDGSEWVRYNQAFGTPINHLSATDGQVLFEVPNLGSFNGQQFVTNPSPTELVSEIDWREKAIPQQVFIHFPVFQG